MLIAANAGFEGSVVVQRVMEGEGSFGFNAETGIYNEKRLRLETREKKTKVNAKNREKASTRQRRKGSKKRMKRNRFGQTEDKCKTTRWLS